MVESCVSDTTLSPEEDQIFTQLSYLSQDWHPNAHAFRLRFYHVTMGCQQTMPFPFDVEHELDEYLARNQFVDAECRLTPEEEFTLLENSNRGNTATNNRFNLLRATLGMAFASGEVPLEYSWVPEP